MPEILHIDGTYIFQTPEDQARERAVADHISAVWGHRLHHFPPLCPVDWYTEKFGRLTGVLELKTRRVTASTYPTIFLSVHKWLCLIEASHGLGVPAAFVVSYLDGVYWVPLKDIDASAHSIGGAPGTEEPVIEVPVLLLRRVRDNGGEARS